MTKVLNPVSSLAAAWLEKLELSSFLTPAQLAAVTHLLECDGKQRATPLSVRATALSNPKSRNTVGMTSTSSHHSSLRSPQIQSALQLTRDGFALLHAGHNFPLIPGNSRLFPVIPSYFQRAPGTQTIKYEDIMKRKTPCGVPIQKISPNLHVIHFAFCIQICISAQERGYSEHLTFCILHLKICNSGAVPPKKIFSIIPKPSTPYTP